MGQVITILLNLYFIIFTLSLATFVYLLFSCNTKFINAFVNLMDNLIIQNKFKEFVTFIIILHVIYLISIINYG